MIRGLKLAVAGLLIVVLGSWETPGRTAMAARAEALDPAQIAAIEKIASYFNEMRTLEGEFKQIGPKGHVSTGVFYISKPGQLRFEYEPPNPFVVVADGTWVAIKNNAKDTADHYPLSATPLRLVLSEEVDLVAEAKILDVEQADGMTMLTLEDKDQMVAGHLVLVFDERKDELQQWIIVDGQGRRTTITLTRVVAGTEPDPALFRVPERTRKPRTSR